MDDIGTLDPAFHRIVGEKGSEFYGFVVIDDFISGRGIGGIRLTADVSLNEIARLAREMTLKFAFLRIPSGGAKAGMVMAPGLSAERRKQLSFEFGEAIGDLLRDGKYVCGLDMGTSLEDLAAITAGAGITDGTWTNETDVDSNYCTALTVLAAADALLDVRGRSLKGTTVMVEGLGKVGSHLLQILRDAGARIVGVSTLSGAIYDRDGLDVDVLLGLRKDAGDDCVLKYPGITPQTSSDLFLKDADLLVPGGGPDSINESNVQQIAARYIVPIANISASPEIEALLQQRGIDYIPGFVSNSGGVFCWRLGRLSHSARENMIRHGLKRRIARLVRQADGSNQSIAEAARQIAMDNLKDMKRVERGGFWIRLTSLLQKLSPRRLGYVIGANILDADWSRQSNPITRWYFDARYFK